MNIPHLSDVALMKAYWYATDLVETFGDQMPWDLFMNIMDRLDTLGDEMTERGFCLAV